MPQRRHRGNPFINVYSTLRLLPQLYCCTNCEALKKRCRVLKTSGTQNAEARTYFALLLNRLACKRARIQGVDLLDIDNNGSSFGHDTCFFLSKLHVLGVGV